MNSSRANASSDEQRLGVARRAARRADSRPTRSSTHLFDRDRLHALHAPLGCAHISAPPRVTSVDVARRAGVSQSTVSLVLSGKAAGRISARTEEAVRAAAARSSATARTSRPARCGPASRAASRSSSPTSPTRSSAACSAAPSAPPSRPATPSCSSTSATTARGRRRACSALLAGPADGLLLFEVDLPPGATEHAIQIEMCPERLPVVRLDVEAGVDLALDHLFGLGHTQIAPPRVELRRADLRPPPRHGCARGSAHDAAVGDARRSRSRARPRRPARCSTRAASRRSSATTTSSPAASTWPRASAASASRATCPWSASTTSTSRACSRRR